MYNIHLLYFNQVVTNINLKGDEMLFDLFILGSIPFIVFCSLFFFALGFEAHGENLGLSVVTLIAFILLMGLCSELAVYSWNLAVAHKTLSIA